jgi:hypothetical protein
MRWLVVVATTLLIAGCSTDEPPAETAESSATQPPTTSTTTSTAPGPQCRIEAPGWLPSELPADTVVLEGSTVTGDLPGDGPAWTTQTLVRVGAGAVIDRQITAYSTSAPSGMAAGGAVVRDQPATVGPGSPSRSGAPVPDAVATWVENDRQVSANGFGVSPDTLVATLDRMAVVDGFLIDPAGRWIELGRVTTPTARRTYLALGTDGDDPALRAAELWVTDGPGTGEGLPESYASLVGSRLTQLDGRTAVVDDTGGYGRVLATTGDGAAVSAAGDLSSEELSAVVVSLEPVPPEDPRLEVVPRGGPSSPEPVCG